MITEKQLQEILNRLDNLEKENQKLNLRVKTLEARVLKNREKLITKKGSYVDISVDDFI